MKKLLYTTSALVGAAFLMEAVVPAKAEIDVSFRYRAALQSMSKKDADKDTDISDGKKDRSVALQDVIHLTFSGSKDHPNGLTTSGFFQLENRNNSATGTGVKGGQKDGVRFKNSFGSIAGSFGKVDVGYIHDIAYRTLGYGTPGTANFGVSDAWFQPSGVFINPSATGSLGGRGQTISYMSNSFSGAQIGASWQPQLGKNGRETGFRTNQGDLEDGLAFVVSYSGSFGGTGVSMGVGMEQAKVASKEGDTYDADNSDLTLLLADGKLAGGKPGSGGDDFAKTKQDPSAFTGYVSFDVDAFTFGGSYSVREQEAANADSSNEHTIMALGASYSVDALTFGIGYAQQDTETTYQNIRTTAATSGTPTTANLEASSAFKQELSKNVLAFTVDYALGDGANIDFVLEQATAESRDAATTAKATGKKETDTSGFGVGIDLKF